MNTPPLKDIPVTVFLAVSIVIVFSLYVTTWIKIVPCGKDIMSIFTSNFVHLDPYHLMSNLFALYALSRVEQQIGAKKFIGLIIFLLIFTTFVEVLVHKIYTQIPCSIGFSGVLFGIMAWELVTNRELDLILVLAIIIMVAVPSIQSEKVSLLGHAVGAIGGAVGGLIWNRLAPVLKLNGS